MECEAYDLLHPINNITIADPAGTKQCCIFCVLKCCCQNRSPDPTIGQEELNRDSISQQGQDLIGYERELLQIWRYDLSLYRMHLAPSQHKITEETDCRKPMVPAGFPKRQPIILRHFYQILRLHAREVVQFRAQLRINNSDIAYSNPTLQRE